MDHSDAHRLVVGRLHKLKNAANVHAHGALAEQYDAEEIGTALAIVDELEQPVSPVQDDRQSQDDETGVPG